MSSQLPTAPSLRALLIGIDCYMPNELPDGTYYKSLAGCVRDILQVEQFLRSEFGLTDERLIRLTASRDDSNNARLRGGGKKPSSSKDGEKPTEPPEQWPTYENIRHAFHQLEESARPGEQVYIHYSGHGGRVSTLAEHRILIPYKFIDEALVPTDLGNQEGRYLRDIELAFLLQKLVDKHLYVTLVLDSCHSGSATREATLGQIDVREATVRGSGIVDDRPKPSLIASDEELAENWRRLSSSITRDFYVGSGWLPDPRDYVLLAACRVHEGAHEYAFDGVNKHGALTYWLLDSFKKFGDGATYHTLQRYIHAKVHGNFPAQNPELEGEGNRLVFGREPRQTPYTFEVVNADETNRQVTLSAGRVHGLGAGARFALYRAGQVDFKRSDQPLAIAEIVQPGITSSTARLDNQSSSSHVESGDQAVLLAPGTDTPRYAVKVLANESAIPKWAKAMVDQLVYLLRQHKQAYVQLAEADEAAEFMVTVNAEGHFCICDSSGAEIPNIKPALSIADPRAPQRVVERLVHLAKYRSVRELKNLDLVSPLLRKFSVDPLGSQADYKPGGPLNPVPFPEAQGTPTIRTGEWVFLRARNHYPPPPKDGIALNVTVLDLRPDWSIQQVFPSRSGQFEVLEPAQELLLPLRADLPSGYNAGIDVIKFFATVKTADLHFLELPPLDVPATHDKATRGASLDLYASRGSDDVLGDSQTRDMGVPLHEGEDWTTREFQIRVTR